MMHVVLKAFAWCPDGTGITREELQPGDERDFGGSAESLAKEGYVEPVKAKAKPDQKQKDGGACVKSMSSAAVPERVATPIRLRRSAVEAKR